MKNETDALNKAIIVLREKRSRELELLKNQLYDTYDSLKPVNLIKSTFEEVSASPEIKSNILSSAIGLGTGFLIKKLLVGNSQSSTKRFFGTMLQFAITNVVAKHVDDAKILGENLLHRILNSSQEPKKELHHNGRDLIS